MFRFTIRDLLWLMVVVGLALGWVADRSRYDSLAYEVPSLRSWKKQMIEACEREDIAILYMNPGGISVVSMKGIPKDDPATLNHP
jgi:hypothetical protein